MTFKPIFNDKDGADKKNYDGSTNTRFEMGENVTTVPLAFTGGTYFTSKNKNKKNKKNDDDEEEEEEQQQEEDQWRADRHSVEMRTLKMSRRQTRGGHNDVENDEDENKNTSCFKIGRRSYITWRARTRTSRTQDAFRICRI